MSFWITTNRRRWLRSARRSKLLRDFVCKILIVFALLCSCLLPMSATQANEIVVNRKLRRIQVFGAGSKPLIESPIGIGRGGLGMKRSMSDCITPAGNFVVDIVLFEKPECDAVSAAVLEKYKSDATAGKLLNSKKGLAHLFSNMDSLDFNGDGRADIAYGAGYIGLSSTNGVTGPKLSTYKGMPYWFSIALHGTPHETKDIGAANSGGCIHLPAAVLRKLIEGRIISVGTRVEVK